MTGSLTVVVSKLSSNTGEASRQAYTTRPHVVSRLFTGDVVFSGDTHAHTFPSNIPKFFAAPLRLTPLALGDACSPPPPDQNDLEPPMLPPYGHDDNPRSCCSPLRMISAFLDAATLLMLTEIERCHGVFCRSDGALGGHGTRPWDGVVKRASVDDVSENYVHRRVRENQSIYWQPIREPVYWQPIDVRENQSM